MTKANNMFIGPYADEVNRVLAGSEARDLGKLISDKLKSGELKFDRGDQIEMSLEEQIERAEFEYERAYDHYNELLWRRRREDDQKMVDIACREPGEDSGLTDIDQSPGRELDDYSEKHGK